MSECCLRTNCIAAVPKRKGRKRKKLYDKDGKRIKVPKGFFSRWSSSDRGNWATSKKKEHKIGPYSDGDEEAAAQKIEADRERQRKNKTRSRAAAKAFKEFKAALGEKSESFGTQRKEPPKYNCADIGIQLKSYGVYRLVT